MTNTTTREEPAMTTATMDLTTATPREIDERLAQLHDELAQANSREAATLETIHYALGERPRWIYRTRKAWPTSNTDALGAARERDPESRAGNYAALTWGCTVAKVELARAAQYTAMTEMQPLREEYDRRPWSRFFVVTSSAGHIHSSMSCSTCRFTTTYGWHPELSGKTETETVEALGPALCSVCFPSAPVDYIGWRIGKSGKLLAPKR